MPVFFLAFFIIFDVDTHPQYPVWQIHLACKQSSKEFKLLCSNTLQTPALLQCQYFLFNYFFHINAVPISVCLFVPLLISTLAVLCSCGSLPSHWLSGSWQDHSMTKIIQTECRGDLAAKIAQASALCVWCSHTSLGLLSVLRVCLCVCMCMCFARVCVCVCEP